MRSIVTSSFRFSHSLARLGWLSVLLMISGNALAANPVKLVAANWNDHPGQLTVAGRYPGSLSGSPLELLDSSGRVLSSITADAQGQYYYQMTVQRPKLLCQVRLKVGGYTAERRVAGVPKDCRKAPQCQILAPAGGVVVPANQAVLFKAQATLKDKKAGPLKLEWDFGGGAMGEDISNGSRLTTYKRPDSTSATSFAAVRPKCS